jgi:hypothetical protein
MGFGWIALTSAFGSFVKKGEKIVSRPAFRRRIAAAMEAAGTI